MRDIPGVQKSVDDLLAVVHEHFSFTAIPKSNAGKFQRGHRAGMTYSRLCVVDALTAASADDAAQRHDRVPIVLDDVAARLADEHASTVAGDDNSFVDGYRAGIEVVMRYLGMARSVHDFSRAPCSSGW